MRGVLPVWVPIVLFAGILVLSLDALEDDTERRRIAEIDATRYRLHTDTKWLSPAWLQELEQLLVEIRRIPTEDAAAIQAAVRRLDGLPFVAEVGTPEVQWPDGLSIPIKMLEPVACVRVGSRDYLPVAANGTVLGGYSFAPHVAYGGWLPTLGRSRDAAERSADLAPGDRLDGAAEIAALSVADSLWRYVRVNDLQRLGRIVVDATAERTPVVDPVTQSLKAETLPGGVVLDLEEGRRIWFGRPPEPSEQTVSSSGELPVGIKWEHVCRGLEALERGEVWALMDVRFDAAVRWTRAEVEAFASDR